MADGTGRSTAEDVRAALAWLERRSSKRTRDGMARYGLPSDNALGVPVGTIQQLAKQLGRNNELSDALWKTGVYEARLLACFVGEPARVTPAQMDRWCREFDNWGVCDTACFHLFDRTPHAWRKVVQWGRRRDEFERRAGFVLLACLAAHDKEADDQAFSRLLPFIERGAADDRNFVKKGVNWALRHVGRRSAALNAAAVTVARRLASSPEPAPRWVGKDALRELTSPKVTARLKNGKRR
jgi:3-methyladenine DNA glycosylase AlkD